ncbi:hypothetical protein PLICRDRAFT_46037 [Plicaturopsis crispa FD-325 SS-3]|uniref:Uncharacterized protein n=1 Tax=Plicaturopsis crispa FD-325 SS-3 TaxID=944288 RepID=A0A0C9SRG9_PLICR|nr:hypothetical protein PLICRDRAFT_46037 [Plicaturopsis crispa FD-325 SS-3]
MHFLEDLANVDYDGMLKAITPSFVNQPRHTHEVLFLGAFTDDANFVLLHVHDNRTDWLRKPFPALLAALHLELLEVVKIGAFDPRNGGVEALLRAGWAAADASKRPAAGCAGRTQVVMDIFLENQAPCADASVLSPIFRATVRSSHPQRFRLP